MDTVIEIFIVSAKQYILLAQQTSDELSSRPGIMSKVLDVKIFNNNPIPERKNRLFISIGDATENIFSGEIINTKIKSKAYQRTTGGLFVLADKPYAVIFGEAEYSLTTFAKDNWISLSSNFNKGLEESTSNDILKIEKTSIRYRITSAMITSTKKAIAAPVSAISSIEFNKNKKDAQLKIKKTKIALAIFLSDVLPIWLSIDTV